MSNYTISVSQTTSQRNQLRPESQNLPSDVGSRFVRGCIPEPIHADVSAADLRDAEKQIVYSIVLECATTKQRCKHISTELLDYMPGIGQRGRRRIVNYLLGSEHFTHERHEVGIKSRAFSVVGFNLADRPVSGAKHTKSSHVGGAQHIGGVPLGIWLGPVVYRMVDLGLVDGLVRTAKEALGWDLAEKEAKKAIEAIELVGVPESDAELFQAALSNIAVKPTRNKKIAEERAEEARGKAQKHAAMIRLFERDPLANIQRKSGRLYTRLSSLPRWARKQYVRFSGGRRAESVDIRCCYLWCLTAQLRQKRMKRGLDIGELNNLLDLIESGGFYEELAKRAGVQTGQAKKSFAVMCLFGDRYREHWGRNRLWFALDALCPQICDEISAWRRQVAGATRLAMYCQRMEGAIMLDGLVPAMAEAGIECAVIHDGALVPEGHGAVAAQAIRDRSASLCGRPCHVSQT